ncbi:MAG: ABC-type transport auxiliary lipoprotein family protein [Gammaproteobacteria bacterium]|nr:ABC-type transport auxiliary lipoprotein family protein [Gammaproteobacteria bacterium]MDH4316228.1 ABC-type transport auxiliary lipoprotein family protein [Gammaproteobacteria bacterium]MDH5214082.1 ABC-type transport auxiliary lipoprotein family protein [Gammaproteobacteria bacterium]
MKTCLRFLLCIGWAAALGGCSGMLTSDQPPEHVYWLDAVTLRSGEPPTENLPDLIVAVHALPGLDTDRILVKEPGARLNYYAGARWPDHLPEVLTATLRLSLESSGRFDHVSSGSHATDAEWSLNLELREFFAVVSTTGMPPQVHVKLAGHMNCGSGDFAITAATTAPARENRLSEIIAAFQHATDNALISLGAQMKTGCFDQEISARRRPPQLLSSAKI